MNRIDVKEKAKSLLKGNLWTVFKAALIVILISMVIESIPSLLGIETVTKEITEVLGQMVEVEKTTLFGYIWSVVTGTLSLILNLGLVNYVLKFIRGKNPQIEDIFNIIKEHWKVTVIVSLITTIIINVGTLLLIVPGVIASIGLTLCNYIIIDNKKLNAKEVLKKSWEMMNGHKWEYFIYILSFFGWILLCVFIVPLYFVLPYMEITFALFYEELKKAK